ncbi:MAG: DUF3089 domain-containing protein [Oscillospiraceae bacterium]|jgi:hypothetical protein|nr:DUF3089 domain-containing protein [Oscillospiraceae bacterium]
MTNYLDRGSWFMLPSGGEPLCADVFLLLPTCCFTSEAACTADSADMREEAELLRPVFSAAFGMARVFAPFYPQVSIDGFAEAAPRSLDQMYAIIDAYPLESAARAFDTYLRYWNQGRPLILAGHSQGSFTLRELMARVLPSCPSLVERIIAVYAVGMPMRQDDLDLIGLPFAQGRCDTGVVISYNVISPQVPIDENPFTQPGALAINPLNWKRDETYASAQENAFSILVDDGPRLEPRFADARIDIERRSVVTNAPIKSSPPWPDGVLHRYDYMLYAGDIRRNVVDRTNAYLANRCNRASSL